MTLLRIGCAFLFGYGLHKIFSGGDWLQQPNVLTWSLHMNDETFMGWVWGELRNLVTIFVILFGLLLLIKVLNRIGMNEVLGRLLRPLLLLLGIGKDATTITIVGMTLGIAFGGGLIIREAHRGHMEKKDIFFSLALMGLSHALIEDTLLMMALGGHLYGLLLGRLIFTIIFIFLLVKGVSRISPAAFERYLFKPIK